MSNSDELMKGFFENIKEHRGGMSIVAKIAGVSQESVRKALTDTKRKHWKSTKRICLITVRVTKLLDYLKQYDESVLTEELQQMGS